MKRFPFILATSAYFLFQSCNSASKDSVDQAKEMNENKDSSSLTATATDSSSNRKALGVDKEDAEFAATAASGGMMEVELGRYAESHGQSEGVKRFGAMMVKDHTKANDELKAIASAKNITLPSVVGEEQKKHMDDVMKHEGRDFDKAYVSMMLDDHKEDVKEFEKMAKEAKDPEIKGFAIKTLPVLLTHLSAVKALNR